MKENEKKYQKELMTQSQSTSDLKLASGIIIISTTLAALISAIAGILNPEKFTNNKFLKYLTPGICFIMILVTLMILSITFFAIAKTKYDNKAQNHDKDVLNFLQKHNINSIANYIMKNADNSITPSELKKKYNKEFFYINRSGPQSFMQWTVGSLVTGSIVPLLLISVIGMINPGKFANTVLPLTFEMFLGTAILAVMLLATMLLINVAKNNTLNSKIEEIKSDLLFVVTSSDQITKKETTR